jgi:hypothetical protein
MPVFPYDFECFADRHARMSLVPIFIPASAVTELLILPPLLERLSTVQANHSISLNDVPQNASRKRCTGMHLDIGLDILLLRGARFPDGFVRISG